MSTLKVNTLSNLAGSKTIGTDIVVDGSAKAWVNFNGTGTVAIRSAFNVTSITDNGTGDYTINFTVAMSDVNYAAAGMAGDSTSNNFYVHGVTYLTTSLRVNVRAQATAFDSAITNVVVFR